MLFISSIIDFKQNNILCDKHLTIFIQLSQTTGKHTVTKSTTNTPKTVPFNRYTPRMSFPSAMVPKTTNRTARHTPFPAMPKQKLDYSCTGKTIRKVSRKGLLSVSEINNQNKMFYHILPDGHAAFFSARGYPEGPTGYWQPAIRS